MVKHQLSNFVRYERGKAKLTQEELAEKAGVGLRFVRELEWGKETLRLDKVNQVLGLFGYTTGAIAKRVLDPYEIMLNHFNKMISVYLKDKTVKIGSLIGQIDEGAGITAWQFLPDRHNAEYRKTNNPELLEIIPHGLIEEIIEL